MQRKPSRLSQLLRDTVQRGNAGCTGADRCMKACPVVAPDVPVSELNDAADDPEWMTERVRQFVIDCVQCGRCATACPAGVPRDEMMLDLRARMPDRPRQYATFGLLRGGAGAQPWYREAAIDAATRLRRKRHVDPRLWDRLDSRQLRRADTLLYFGCYAFSETRSPTVTLDLAGELGDDFEVLAGLKTCCGWPQYLSGDLERAEELLEALWSQVEQVEPKVVVSGCAECVTAMQVLARRAGGSFEAISTAEWILRNQFRFDLAPGEEAVTFHDSCHLTRRLGRGDNARLLLGTLHPLEEMAEAGEDALCCGYYGFDVNRVATHALRRRRLDQARATGARVMAVECVTCKESFDAVNRGTGLEVVEVQWLVWDALQRAKKPPTPPEEPPPDEPPPEEPPPAAPEPEDTADEDSSDEVTDTGSAPERAR